MTQRDTEHVPSKMPKSTLMLMSESTTARHTARESHAWSKHVEGCVHPLGKQTPVSHVDTDHSR